MWITDETMQEMDYELAQYRAIDGIEDVERFVSLNDWEHGDCIHEFGEWTDHFPFDGRAPWSSFTCFDCGAEFEVK